MCVCASSVRCQQLSLFDNRTICVLATVTFYSDLPLSNSLWFPFGSLTSHIVYVYFMYFRFAILFSSIFRVYGIRIHFNIVFYFFFAAFYLSLCSRLSIAATIIVIVVVVVANALLLFCVFSFLFSRIVNTHGGLLSSLVIVMLIKINRKKT